MIKLIIVDDHSHVRQAWSWVLNQVPRLNVIAQCANGQEAIEAAKNLQPDVILMDINMKPVNGIEATRSIREFAPDMKIIGVSVQAERSYVNEMLRNGANGYVTKNSPSTEMVIAIDEVLAGKTYICEEIREPKSGIKCGDSRDRIMLMSSSSLNATRGRNPSNSNSRLSSSNEGLGVVSSLSPAKIELAPARKQRACSAWLISARPALSLTMVAGIRIRAVAIIRTISQTSTLHCPQGVFL